ncbi:ABC transporter ATP-binding protein/permease [Escherichia coli]|nr:ABC transporter ATP-binding protein/permease [Escherichia coli]
MVYTVVLIVIGGTLFTHKVGKRIRPLNVGKNNVAKRHFELILCSIISRQN